MARGRSFLSAFGSVVHALEAAAVVAAPIVRTLEPEVGGLMMAATRAAVGAEALITTPASGPARLALVQEQTQAVFDVVNKIRTARGQSTLGPEAVSLATTQAAVVVDLLNAVTSAAEEPAGASASSGG